MSKSSILVGGQAVIEGVMMRVPGAYSTAVRDPQGDIHTDRHDFESVVDRKPYLKKPILRGAISLFEAMKMGFQTLQWSTDIAMPEEEKPHPFVDVLMTIFSVLLAIGLFLRHLLDSQHGYLIKIKMLLFLILFPVLCVFSFSLFI